MKRWYALAIIGTLFLVIVLRRGEACQGCQERKAKLLNYLQGD